MNNNFNIINVEQIPFYEKLEKYNKNDVATLLSNMNSTMLKDDFSRYMYYFYVYNVPYNSNLADYKWSNTSNTMCTQDWFNYCVQYGGIIVDYMIKHKISNIDHLEYWFLYFKSMNLQCTVNLFKYCLNSNIFDKFKLCTYCYDNSGPIFTRLNRVIFETVVYSGDAAFIDQFLLYTGLSQDILYADACDEVRLGIII